MTTIKRSALVSYTPRQMFELVNSIEDYPRFLPWCRSTEVLKRTEKEVEASIEIAWSGMHKSLTSRNQLFQFDRIEITLVKGPFRHLEGRWGFVALGELGCRVNLELEFELTGHIVDKVFQPIFHHIANSLVDAFCRRAVAIYGTN
ncbi:MAG: type II toxin-antitoxin system RatA family toxin [Gammaproteobacteria bacterium]